MKKLKDKKITKTKQCDFCGETFTGKNYTVFDENFKKDKNVFRCEKCFSDSLVY